MQLHQTTNIRPYWYATLPDITPQLQLELQLQLQITLRYRTTTVTTTLTITITATLQAQLQPQLQLQLHYITDRGTNKETQKVIERVRGRKRLRASAIFRLVSGFASTTRVSHRFRCENSATALRGTTGTSELQMFSQASLVYFGPVLIFNSLSRAAWL